MSALARLASELLRMPFDNFSAYLILSSCSAIVYQHLQSHVNSGYRITAAMLFPVLSGALIQHITRRSLHLTATYCFMLSTISFALGDVARLIDTHFVAFPNDVPEIARHRAIHCTLSFTVLSELQYIKQRYYDGKIRIRPLDIIITPLPVNLLAWYYYIDRFAEGEGRKPCYIPPRAIIWRPILLDLLLMFTWLAINFAANCLVIYRFDLQSAPRTPWGFSIVFPAEGILGLWLSYILMRPVRLFVALMLGSLTLLVEWRRSSGDRWREDDLFDRLRPHIDRHVL